MSGAVEGWHVNLPLHYGFYKPEQICIQAQYQLKEDQPLAVFETILVEVNLASSSPQCSMHVSDVQSNLCLIQYFS